MKKILAIAVVLFCVCGASAQSTLQSRIETFLVKTGKSVNFDHRRPLVEMEDQANGKGSYIAKWDSSLGPPPSTADGFSDYELHRLK